MSEHPSGAAPDQDQPILPVPTELPADRLLPHEIADYRRWRRTMDPDHPLRGTATVDEQRRYLQLEGHLAARAEKGRETFAATLQNWGDKLQKTSLEKHSLKLRAGAALAIGTLAVYAGYQGYEAYTSSQTLMHQLQQLGVGSFLPDVSKINLGALVPQVFPPRGPDAHLAFDPMINAWQKNLTTIGTVAGTHANETWQHTKNAALGGTAALVGQFGRPLDRLKGVQGVVGKGLSTTGATMEVTGKGAEKIGQGIQKVAGVVRQARDAARKF